MNIKFYITTTLPYVNGDPHIGFAMEIIRADTIARYHRLLGEKVVFNTGTDEHGQKIYQKALEENKTPQEYCDEHALKYKNLKNVLNLSFTNFIRTTDSHHIKAAQEFWKRCDKNGDIYKAKYEIKYCVGCELEKTDSELIDGKCPIHPNRPIEIIEEENYFFRFSNYQQKLLDFYNSHPGFVVPEFRFEEIKKFVSSGLKDFSISRVKAKMPWGIEVPGDPEQVMYVWFDALIDYISTLGWPENKEKFNNFWPGTQIAGKDNLRQQSAMWQAMLKSAGLSNSKQIYIEGFITSDGQKISKSLGNVIDPVTLTKKYGIDPVRYYLLREIPSYEDGDFSQRRFIELFNADLANGLGNLLSRVLTLVNKNCGGKIPDPDRNPETHPLRTEQSIHNWKKTWLDIDNYLPQYRFDLALESIWKFITEANKYIDQTEPWKLIEKDKKEFNWVIYGLLDSLAQIAWQLYPFLPGTAVRIAQLLKIEGLLTKEPIYKDSWTNIKPGTTLLEPKPLFPRIK